MLYLQGVRDLRRPDFLTRYFLRRLAAVQRERRRPPAGGPPIGSSGIPRAYSRALSDAAALFVLLPGIALFSIAASITLTLQPTVLSAAPAGSPLVLVLLATFVLVLLGHVGLGLRLRRFRNDLGAARAYDTERDREIAFWQRLIVTALCGFAAPLCALAIVSNS